MMKTIIIGTGAQAKYVVNNLGFQKEIQIEGLLETVLEKRMDTLPFLLDKPVLGGLEVLHKYPKDQVSLVIALSNNKQKAEITKSLLDKGFSFINCIHPTAVIAPSAELGTGLIINPYAVIQPLAKVGNFVMVHAGVIIEHDNIIEDYVNLAPGVKLAGWVHVRKKATICTGATIIPRMKIGRDAIVGAGSVVIKDVPDNQVVCGVPARKIRDL